MSSPDPVSPPLSHSQDGWDGVLCGEAFSEAIFTHNSLIRSTNLKGLAANKVEKFPRGKGSDHLHLLGVGFGGSKGTSRPELCPFSYLVL